eukprot:TRINITY_DN17221_c0_g1_i2.p2 TRINITY_DN17221_c0_g1~~TRINITY_DN17221_c0_g1_i2.p2  ORF type:complete len:150 (-),score=40.75 TRINITY_DN17221_c0_g1_i2:1-450(-)
MKLNGNSKPPCNPRGQPLNFDLFAGENVELREKALKTEDVLLFPLAGRVRSVDLSGNEIDSCLDLGLLCDKFPQLRTLLLSSNRLGKIWRIRVDGAGGNIFKDSKYIVCLLYTSPSPRDRQKSRMPSSACKKKKKKKTNVESKTSEKEK